MLLNSSHGDVNSALKSDTSSQSKSLCYITISYFRGWTTTCHKQSTSVSWLFILLFERIGIGSPLHSNILLNLFSH